MRLPSTQEQLDEILSRRLERDRRKHFRALEVLRVENDALRAEVRRLSMELTHQIEQRIDDVSALRSANMRLQQQPARGWFRRWFNRSAAPRDTQHGAVDHDEHEHEHERTPERA